MPVGMVPARPAGKKGILGQQSKKLDEIQLQVCVRKIAPQKDKSLTGRSFLFLGHLEKSGTIPMPVGMVPATPAGKKDILGQQSKKSDKIQLQVCVRKNAPQKRSYLTG
jgi:hypothetical protein